MPEKQTKLERRLGYNFRDAALLERSLTHRSWAHENRLSDDENMRDAQNESLEFVGDSVLGLVMAEELYLKNPTLNEGQLTLMKHRLVSTEMLAKVSAELDLGSFLRVGKGEEKTGGRGKQALLADALEAVIGAVFFDSGYVEARQFIKNIFAKELKIATPDGSVDYKTMLQEKLQAKKMGTPEYRVVKTDGLPHERRFWVEAVWENGTSSGEGTSIKAAEMMAARRAIESLNGKGVKTQP
jgi:ribonuclease III, bacterial